jgi:hypothetical protein
MVATRFVFFKGLSAVDPVFIRAGICILFDRRRHYRGLARKTAYRGKCNQVQLMISGPFQVQGDQGCGFRRAGDERQKHNPENRTKLSYMLPLSVLTRTEVEILGFMLGRSFQVTEQSHSAALIFLLLCMYLVRMVAGGIDARRKKGSRILSRGRYNALAELGIRFRRFA